MTSSEVRQKFLEFFKQKGHAVVPSSSLVPDDASVLLTTAGMQQFKPYYTGDLDPLKDVHPNLGRPLGSKSVVSVQKSFRTSDIDEVGDSTHLTFFEMLGNFSFGGYFKKEAIEYAHEFITKELGLRISYVTVFRGLDVVPKDEESRAVWNSLGVVDVREQGMDDVFWGPTGKSGPCGPTTEIYCKNAAGEDVEIWNIVFNQYFYPGSREELLAGTPGKKLQPLEVPGVDTGMGLERLMAVVQKKPTIFETDLFEPTLEFLGSMPYFSKRIVADHVRASVFLTSDGVLPSNKEAGSILRGLIRRAIPHLRERQFLDAITPGGEIKKWRNISDVAKRIIEQYSPVYNELESNRDKILSIFTDENTRFRQLYEKGKKVLDKLIVQSITDGSHRISGQDIFNLVTTHGFPLEWIKDEAGRSHAIELDLDSFHVKFKKHQDLSRTASAGMFKGGLADASERTMRVNSAHHLLLKALQIVLGPEVKQRGSNITGERLRMDFVHGEKMTEEQKLEVERMVNEKISEDLPVIRSEMPLAEAEKLGAEHEFGQKYPERVSVYSVGPKEATPESPRFSEAFSLEFCGGPHVSRTKEIGKFKILKEEAVSAGIRRIRATVE